MFEIKLTRLFSIAIFLLFVLSGCGDNDLNEEPKKNTEEEEGPISDNKYVNDWIYKTMDE